MQQQFSVSCQSAMRARKYCRAQKLQWAWIWDYDIVWWHMCSSKHSTSCKYVAWLAIAWMANHRNASLSKFLAYWEPGLELPVSGASSPSYIWLPTENWESVRLVEPVVCHLPVLSPWLRSVVHTLLLASLTFSSAHEAFAQFSLSKLLPALLKACQYLEWREKGLLVTIHPHLFLCWIRWRIIWKSSCNAIEGEPHRDTLNLERGDACKHQINALWCKSTCANSSLCRHFDSVACTPLLIKQEMWIAMVGGLVYCCSHWQFQRQTSRVMFCRLLRSPSCLKFLNLSSFSCSADSILTAATSCQSNMVPDLRSGAFRPAPPAPRLSNKACCHGSGSVLCWYSRLPRLALPAHDQGAEVMSYWQHQTHTFQGAFVQTQTKSKAGLSCSGHAQIRYNVVARWSPDSHDWVVGISAFLRYHAASFLWNCYHAVTQWAEECTKRRPHTPIRDTLW